MQNPDSKETTDATGGHIKLNVDRRQQQRRLRLRLRHWRRPGGSNSLDTTTSATATAKATATITRAITTAVTTTTTRTTLINNPRRAAQNLGAFLDRILIAIRTHNPASLPQSWALPLPYTPLLLSCQKPDRSANFLQQLQQQQQSQSPID